MKKGTRIYVAGGGQERELAAGYIARLREAGFVITYDWTTSPGWTTPHNREQDVEQAREDFKGVLSAEVVWVLVPDQKSEGSHFEMGVALAANIRTVVSGPHVYRPHRIFTLLADETYATHEEAFEALIKESVAPTKESWSPDPTGWRVDESSYG